MNFRGDDEMGLDTSHDCWHGAYSAFMRWRQEIAKAAGLPPLELMEGFFSGLNSGVSLPTLWHHPIPEYSQIRTLDERLPIKWECLKPSPLHELLYHSDCDGDIPWQSCGPIADALEALLPALDAAGDAGHIGLFAEKTKTFIAGLRAAFAAQENVDFH